jgi:MarR family transcriptional regulator, 2-MHQ and catechol-resistance regulon repressor
MGDSSGTHLYLVLMKAYRTMARHAHRSIAAHDLGFSDFTILEALLHKGPMLVNEIGRRIELTSGSITTASRRFSCPQHAQGRQCYDARQEHVSSRRSRDQSWIQGEEQMAETVQPGSTIGSAPPCRCSLDTHGGSGDASGRGRGDAT